MEVGGAKGDRTPDLLHAMQALSQLSYGPTRSKYHSVPDTFKTKTISPRSILQHVEEINDKIRIPRL